MEIIESYMSYIASRRKRKKPAHKIRIWPSSVTRLSFKKGASREFWIYHHTQSEAAEILGVTRPRVSDVINKKAIKFTIDALVDMVARTGKHVRLSVQ